MKKLIVLSFITFSFSLYCQTSLVFYSPFHASKNIINFNFNGPSFGNKLIIDTIVVPTNKVLKIESCAIGRIENINSKWVLNDFGSTGFYNIEIGDLILYQLRNEMQPYRAEPVLSIPMWLGSGTHFVYLNSAYQGSLRFSLHGLVFSTN
jgi:hypothetical protein